VLKTQPSVSFIIPTLNAQGVLSDCLRSIRNQNYSPSKIEILIIDGGSKDNTVEIAKSFGCQILANPLKTAEAGKSVGVKNAKGKYLALVDSDNILPSQNWLIKMVEPLEKDIDIIGSEPWKYTYRRLGGYIERYSALTGVNDPYALIAGVFDRKNYIRNGWTNINLSIENFAGYHKATLLKNNALPTIGANGTVFRTSFIQSNFNSDYLIDVDVIAKILQTKSPLFFAKVKIGIIHTFCESSIKKFYKKQNRRVTDLYIYRALRTFSENNTLTLGSIKFALYVILILPMIFDTLKGYIKKPDPAWFFHPVACILTLFVYALGTIKYKLGILKPINRLQWQQ
jgi:glycosyltransferase involved in cell wall biosynthesis